MAKRITQSNVGEMVLATVMARQYTGNGASNETTIVNDIAKAYRGGRPLTENQKDLVRDAIRVFHSRGTLKWHTPRVSGCSGYYFNNYA